MDRRGAVLRRGYLFCSPASRYRSAAVPSREKKTRDSIHASLVSRLITPVLRTCTHAHFYIFVHLFFFFHPIYYLRPSILSLSLLVVTQIRGHIAGSSLPLHATVRALHFYREKMSALPSLVDSRRIVLTHARR